MVRPVRKDKKKEKPASYRSRPQVFSHTADSKKENGLRKNLSQLERGHNNKWPHQSFVISADKCISTCGKHTEPGNRAPKKKKSGS